jgi:integrase/recombinase XerD
MSNPKIPSSSVLVRFRQDLKLSGLSERTQESYLRAVRKFSEFINKCPSLATEDDLRNYLLHIQENLKWKPSTVNVAQNGLKAFFKLTCPQDWPTLDTS